MMVQGESRIRVKEWLPEDPYPTALVEEVPNEDDPVDAATLKRAIQGVRRTRGLLSELGTRPALSFETTFDEDPRIACWQICAEAPLSMIDAQRLLASPGVMARLELLIVLTDAVEFDLRAMLAQN